MTPRRRRWLTIVLIVGAVAAGLLVFQYRANRVVVVVYRTKLQVDGEKLKVEELIPPRVSDAQNSAVLLRDAMRALKVRDGMLATNSLAATRMISPGRRMVRFQHSEICNQGATNSWADLESVLEQHKEALQLLGQLPERPACDFDLDYGRGMMIPLPHLSSLRACAGLLAAASLAQLRDGDVVTAHAHLGKAFALVNALENERLLISQLVRIAIAHFGLNVCWEFLQSERMTQEQLQQLQQLISGVEFIRAAEPTLSMERAICDTTLIQCRNRQGSVQDKQLLIERLADESERSDKEGAGGVSFWRGWKLKLREDAWRYWWSYPDQLNALRIGQINIEAARQVQVDGFFSNALARQASRLAELEIQPMAETDTSLEAIELRAMFSQSMVSNAKYLSRVMTIEALRQLTITAIALKRYQMRRGSFPEQLESLVPEYLGAVPRDPVDGNSLRYRREGEASFTLYSVGEDGVDNNGDPRPANEDSKTLLLHRGRDWVWPQPATPEEIAAYEEARLGGN